MVECYQRIACFGGVYSNYLALAAAIDDARNCRAEQLFCLGDLGAFGPHPDRVFPLLDEHSLHATHTCDYKVSVSLSLGAQPAGQGHSGATRAATPS